MPILTFAYFLVGFYDDIEVIGGNLDLKGNMFDKTYQLELENHLTTVFLFALLRELER